MKVAVVGAQGFIGSTVAREVHRDQGDENLLRVGRAPGSQEFLAFDGDGSAIGPPDWPSVDLVIYAAGPSSHALGDTNAAQQWQQTLIPLATLLDQFNGTLVLLSSQAVYSGLVGPVPEDVVHTPVMPYGLSKLHAEQLAQSRFSCGKLQSLQVHRLMYTYGPGERQSRLIPRISTAIASGSSVSVQGLGRSFINPLRVDFVARFLVAAAIDLARQTARASSVVNLCHGQPLSVADVLSRLQESFAFEFALQPGGEDWPVTFHGVNEQMTSLASRLGLLVPEPLADLRDHLSTDSGSIP